MNKANIESLLFLMSLSLFLSCSKSEDAAPPSIVGSWRLSAASITDCTNSSQNFVSDYSGTNLIYVFTGSSTSGTYTFGGYNKSGPVSSLSGTYTITANKNLIFVGGYNGTTAITVSATTLTFKNPSNYAAGCVGNSTLVRL